MNVEAPTRIRLDSPELARQFFKCGVRQLCRKYHCKVEFGDEDSISRWMNVTGLGKDDERDFTAELLERYGDFIH